MPVFAKCWSYFSPFCKYLLSVVMCLLTADSSYAMMLCDCIKFWCYL